MSVINQTASISGITSNFGLFITFMCIGIIIIFIVWIYSQINKS